MTPQGCFNPGVSTQRKVTTLKALAILANAFSVDMDENDAPGLPQPWGVILVHINAEGVSQNRQRFQRCHFPLRRDPGLPQPWGVILVHINAEGVSQNRQRFQRCHFPLRRDPGLNNPGASFSSISTLKALARIANAFSVVTFLCVETQG